MFAVCGTGLVSRERLRRGRSRAEDGQCIYKRGIVQLPELPTTYNLDLHNSVNKVRDNRRAVQCRKKGSHWQRMVERCGTCLVIVPHVAHPLRDGVRRH